jgi:hypothetical protein
VSNADQLRDRLLSVINRVFGIEGLDRVASIYPSIEAAAAARSRPRSA